MQRIFLLWKEFDVALGAVIFVAYLLIDGLYAYYTFAVVKKKPFSAATTGFLMHFLLAVGVINYVNNFLYVIPLALGSWFGTYLVVARERSKEPQLDNA